MTLLMTPKESNKMLKVLKADCKKLDKQLVALLKEDRKCFEEEISEIKDVILSGIGNAIECLDPKTYPELQPVLDRLVKIKATINRERCEDQNIIEEFFRTDLGGFSCSIQHTDVVDMFSGYEAEVEETKEADKMFLEMTSPQGVDIEECKALLAGKFFGDYALISFNLQLLELAALLWKGAEIMRATNPKFKLPKKKCVWIKFSKQACDYLEDMHESYSFEQDVAELDDEFDDDDDDDGEGEEKEEEARDGAEEEKGGS